MSAYICDRDVFIYLVQAATSRELRKNSGDFSWYHNSDWCRLNQADMEGSAALANLLYLENILSVAGRYPDDKSSRTLPGPTDAEQINAEDFELAHWIHFDPVQVLQTLACLRYQSCEHDGWKDSEACAVLDAIKEDAIRVLPGYAAAEWGAPKRSQKMKRFNKP